MADAIGELGLDVTEFQKALVVVNAELNDLLIESKKLNAEIALLERNMFNAGGGTKAQAKELKALKVVSEDFTEQIKQAKEQQKAFSEASEKAATSVQKVGLSMQSVLRFVGAAVGVESLMNLFNQFRRLEEEAVKLDQDIAKLGQSDGNPQFKTLDVLQAKIGAINKDIEELTKEKGPVESILETLRQGFEDFAATDEKETVAFKRAEQLNALLKKRAELQQDVAAKVLDQNELIELQVEALKEEGNGLNTNLHIADQKREILANELHYQELIGKAISDGNNPLVEALNIQKQDTEELIKQKYELQQQNALLQQRKALSGIASDQAGTAISGILGDQENQDIIAGREADKKQSEMDLFHQQEQASGQRAIQDKAQRDKQIMDMARRNIQNATNEEITADIGDIGSPQSQKYLDTHNQYNQLRKKYIADHNDAALEQIDRQEAQAQQRNLAAEHNVTVPEKIAQRDAARHEATQAKQQTDREQELRNRAARGQDSKDIRDQLEKDKVQGKMDADVDKAQKEAAKEVGWTQGDSANLKGCYDQLQKKD